MIKLSVYSRNTIHTFMDAYVHSKIYNGDQYKGISSPLKPTFLMKYISDL